MKICFPVQQNEGLKSGVYNHFGSAPMFMVVDAETNSITPISNGDQHHTHGMCSPMKALNGQEVNAIVVGGIGGGALMGLNRMGIKVYRSQGGTIQDNIALYKNGMLQELTPEQCCGGHSHGGCAH